MRIKINKKIEKMTQGCSVDFTIRAIECTIQLNSFFCKREESFYFRIKSIVKKRGLL